MKASVYHDERHTSQGRVQGNLCGSEGPSQLAPADHCIHIVQVHAGIDGSMPPPPQCFEVWVVPRSMCKWCTAERDHITASATGSRSSESNAVQPVAVAKPVDVSLASSLRVDFSGVEEVKPARRAAFKCLSGPAAPSPASRLGSRPVTRKDRRKDPSADEVQSQQLTRSATSPALLCGGGDQRTPSKAAMLKRTQSVVSEPVLGRSTSKSSLLRSGSTSNLSAKKGRVSVPYPRRGASKRGIAKKTPATALSDLCKELQKSIDNILGRSVLESLIEERPGTFKPDSKTSEVLRLSKTMNMDISTVRDLRDICERHDVQGCGTLSQQEPWSASKHDFSPFESCSTHTKRAQIFPNGFFLK